MILVKFQMIIVKLKSVIENKLPSKKFMTFQISEALLPDILYFITFTRQA